MSVIWIQEQSTESTVPLIPQYLQNGGQLGDEDTVVEIVITTTGALLVGSKFKGIVFRSKQTFQHLLTALEYFVANPNESLSFVTRIEPNGYIAVGTDSETAGYNPWIKDGSKFRLSNETVQPAVDSNPFFKAKRPGVLSEVRPGSSGKTKQR
jgi:hypothetical protein